MKDDWKFTTTESGELSVNRKAGSLRMKLKWLAMHLDLGMVYRNFRILCQIYILFRQVSAAVEWRQTSTTSCISPIALYTKLDAR